ncbi:receptor-mediated endocytosis protein 6 homolog isoform X4 [Drosophila kikkawai]|uniref:Receptor-mediated endocytosis protein 6 homolog isoform X4 n=1 Tax=Drosophila kikkawai TaxID=30033 RepID=A0ABM4GPW8_DROKI
MLSSALPGRLPCLRSKDGEFSGRRPGSSWHHALLRRLGGDPGQAGQAKERHIEEVTLKNKTEIEQHHARHQAKMQAQAGHSTTGTDSTGSASSTLHYVNELIPIGEHRKKQRRHRHREREERAGERERERERDRDRQHPNTTEIGVHRGPAKRPSIRQKLFGQSIVHKKLVEAQSDSADSTGPGPGPGSSRGPGHSSTTTSNPADKRQRLQRMDTLALPQVARTSSAP